MTSTLRGNKTYSLNRSAAALLSSASGTKLSSKDVVVAGGIAISTRHLHKCQSLIRMWLARNTYRKIVARHKKRTEILKELVSSERSYVSQLRSIVELYLQPLKQHIAFAPAHAMLSEGDFQSIFSSLENIVFYNGVFLENLEKKQKEWDPLATRLGDVFLIVADFAIMYAKYSANHRIASQRIAFLCQSQSKDFSNFLVQQSKKLPAEFSQTKANLTDLLSLPCQRMEEYHMLLEDLWRHSWLPQDMRDLTITRNQISTLIGSSTQAKDEKARMQRARSPGPVGMLKSHMRSKSGAHISEKDLKEKETKEKIKSPEKQPKKETQKEKENSLVITPSKANIKISKDEALWSILKISLEGMELKESDVKSILAKIERNLIKPPRRSKTLLVMKKIENTTSAFNEKNIRDTSAIKIQSVFRGWREREGYRRLAKSYGKSLGARNKTFRELLTTERDYGRNLQLVVKEYLMSLRDLMKKKTVAISPGDLAIIFGNIESIYDAHLIFMSSLEKENEKWPDLNGIGTIFSQNLIPALGLYTDYVRNCKRAKLTLDRYAENEKFTQSLQQILTRVNQSGTELSFLLTCPLNRISRYNAQIETLYKMTPNFHGDFDNLVNAFHQTEEALRILGESILASENQAKLFEVKRRIDVTSGTVLTVFDEERQFLREGLCTLIEGKKKSSRYIFLFNDLVLVTKPQTKTKNFTFIKTITFGQEKSKSIPSLSVFPDSNSLKYAFKLSVGDENFIFIWKQNEYEEWLKLFKRTVLPKKSKDEPLKEKSPINTVREPKDRKFSSPNFEKNKALFETPEKSAGMERQPSNIESVIAKPKLMEQVRRARGSTTSSPASRKYKTWDANSKVIFNVNST
eukprot:TRINITY_DN3616_c0_g1_i1.p1 TRINITY_DN3616_c0_g1~~TRINITY_DN3616_c0_g1_i1.p1  ORF type:complete len:861 (-),score=258.21 TRINITY_DN3616_c0_g1_i1:521-3103(-)